MTKMKKEGIKLFIVALASFLILVFCIGAAAPDSTLRFIDPTPANYTQEQDFTWGVLAINTHKSIYLPNEAAVIGIAVLDNEGRMVCDAAITLTITDPSNIETVLSTSNGLIKVSPQCCVYGVTNLPDYYTNYTVDCAGTYVMNLIAVTPDGTKSITDEFSVQNSVDFDVARDGPTRIYPPVSYEMNFTIKANKDYDGLIREYVPASFVITPQDGLTVTTVGDTKILTWTRNLVKGETYNIYYEFDAPDVSPYLFTLGALEIGSFKEVRQWQIANDAPVTYYFNAWSTAEEWKTTPQNMVDGTESNYAETKTANDVELLTGNDCPGTDLGTISKVEIRAFGYCDDADNGAYLRPIFDLGDGSNYDAAIPPATGAWGLYRDITIDPPNAPSAWIWSNVSTLDCDVEYYSGAKADDVYVGEVEIRVTYYTPTSWESYNCLECIPACLDATFSGDEHTLYMHGTGFLSDHQYRVAYYDAPGAKTATAHMLVADDVDSVGDVLDSDCVFTTWKATADAGEWHAIVCERTKTPPSTYDSTWPYIIKDDIFNVADSAIPEFPDVIAAIAVCMLCAVAYVVMRRRAGKR
jgi:hypothetical protein